MVEPNQVIMVDKWTKGSTLKDAKQYFQRESEVVEALLCKEGVVIQYKTNTDATCTISKLNQRSFKGNWIDVHLVNSEEWGDVFELLDVGAGAEDMELIGILSIFSILSLEQKSSLMEQMKTAFNLPPVFPRIPNPN